MNLKQNHTSIFFLLFDFCVISFLFVGILYLQRTDWFTGLDVFTITFYLIKFQYKSYFLILFSWFLISEYTDFYKNSRFIRYLTYIRRIIFQIFLFSFILFGISGIKNENLFTNKESLLFIVSIAGYVSLSRSLMFFSRKYLFTKGYDLKSVIIVGQNDNTQNLISLLSKRKDLGLVIKNIFVDKDPSEGQFLLELNQLKEYLIHNKIDYAYICLNNGINEEMINPITEILEKHYISISFIPNASLETKQTLEINYLDSFPLLTYKKYPLDFSFNQIIKRGFDLVFTFFVFVFILSWVYPILTLLVLIYQGRPIHFSQKRNGLNGKEFNCLKFRSMRDDKHNNLKPTERNDPRVTKLGRVLRKTSLDELPQFINVLKGEMSIVGPRPHMVSENESYSDVIKRYSLRHYVKPGITGLAQIKGYRGAVDTDRDMEMRIRTDIYYVRNWSFLLDIFIIYKTAKLMVFGDENAI